MSWAWSFIAITKFVVALERSLSVSQGKVLKMQSVSSFKPSEWTDISLPTSSEENVYIFSCNRLLELKWPHGWPNKTQWIICYKTLLQYISNLQRGPVHPVPPHVSTFLILPHESSSPWFSCCKHNCWLSPLCSDSSAKSALPLSSCYSGQSKVCPIKVTSEACLHRRLSCQQLTIKKRQDAVAHGFIIPDVRQVSCLTLQVIASSSSAPALFTLATWLKSVL